MVKENKKMFVVTNPLYFLKVELSLCTSEHYQNYYLILTITSKMLQKFYNIMPREYNYKNHKESLKH